MTGEIAPTSRKLKAPRAAAIAGVLFAALMFIGLGVVRMAVPPDPARPGAWLTTPEWQHAIQYALHLVPIAGIAFLWFMGVLRDRLGAFEDRFFATVFFGSGLLFAGSLFASAATATALVQVTAGGDIYMPNSETYYFARRMSYVLLNVFAIKMAGVFMFSTCAMALRTAFLPRWLAYSGFASGLALIVVITNWEWIALLFPLWILVVSIHILVATFGEQSVPEYSKSNPDFTHHYHRSDQ